MADDLAAFLDAAEARAAAATPGPWEYGTAPHLDSGETRAEFLTDALLDGDEPLWTTWADNDTDDGFDYIIPAITGDGPTSAANAAFIAAARSDLPVLVGMVRAVRALCDSWEHYPYQNRRQVIDDLRAALAMPPTPAANERLRDRLDDEKAGGL